MKPQKAGCPSREIQNEMQLPGEAAGKGGEEGAVCGPQAGLSGNAAVAALGPAALGERERLADSDFREGQRRARPTGPGPETGRL